MSVDLTSPIYHNEEAARRHFEAVRWPDGPVCPHCGSIDNAHEMQGKSTRPGLYKCRDCAKPFTATIGTLFERSHIPLHKWLLATHLLTSSKEGHERASTLAQSWLRLLSHGMVHGASHSRVLPRFVPDEESGPLGGKNKVVEADETYVGGKAKNRKGKVPPKEAVFSLVERGGKGFAPSTSPR